MRTIASAAVLAAVLAGASLPTPTFAQEQPEEDDGRASAFESATGPTRETVPGGRLLVLAYALIWLAILGFVAVQWRRTLRLESEVDRLRRALDEGTREPSRDVGGGGP